MVCNPYIIICHWISPDQYEIIHRFTDQFNNAVLINSTVNAYVAAIGCVAGPESEPEYGMTRTKDYALYKIYKDAAVSTGHMLLPLFKDTLTLYNFYADKTLAQLEEAPNKNEISLLVKSFLNRSKQIQMDHYDYSLLQIMTNLHYNMVSLPLVDPEVLIETRAVLTHCLYTLLRKIVGSQSLDVTLGLACLFMLTEKKASEWFSSACRSLVVITIFVSILRNFYNV